MQILRPGRNGFRVFGRHVVVDVEIEGSEPMAAGLARYLDKRDEKWIWRKIF
jgi:hypothetical protein